MNILEAARLAIATLWGNRLRSFLTVLGNVVAVLSVVALVAVIQGLDKFVSKELLATGSNAFVMTKFGIIMGYEEYLKALERPDITLDDARHLERTMTTAAAVVPFLEARLSVKRGRNQAEGAPVRGTGAGYPLVGRFTLSDGRDIAAVDVDGNAAVAVIGSRIAEKLYPGEDPIGRDLRVGGSRYTVVGVLEPRGGTMGGSQDDQVLLPVTTLLKQVGARARSLDISVVALDAANYEAAQEEAELLLKIRRGLKPWDKPNFDLLTDEQLFGIYRKITAGIYGLLLGVVSLSLLIGGIVIMNIMLVSVTERTREIGIRKAVGARRRDIVTQFLVESVFLATGGGVLGVLLGIGAALVVRAATPLPASVQLWSVLVGMLLASSVGIFFGIYPAWRASRLAPIAALRHET
jgi:putative ABC transport system permease protein